jgi:hypothetical protein
MNIEAGKTRLGCFVNGMTRKLDVFGDVLCLGKSGRNNSFLSIGGESAKVGK